MSKIGVGFKRGTREEISSTTILDGQVLWETDQGANNRIYNDVGSTRTIIGGKTDVVDALTSESDVDALSANQGKILNEKISEKAKISHAYGDGTYGLGTPDLFGHVSLADDINYEGTAVNGRGASSLAVKKVNDKAVSAQTTANSAQMMANLAQVTANAALPKAGGSVSGTVMFEHSDGDTSFNGQHSFGIVGVTGDYLSGSMQPGDTGSGTATQFKIRAYVRDTNVYEDVLSIKDTTGGTSEIIAEFHGKADTAINAAQSNFQIGNAVITASSNQFTTIQAENGTDHAITLGVRENAGGTAVWSLSPYASDGQIDLGVDNLHWRNIYATNGTIQVSDRNAKQNFAPLTDAHADFILGLEPTSYTMKDGTSGRTHTGFIAQDVESLMQSKGFASTDMSVVCKSGDAYAMRYDELIAPLVALCQRQQAEIEELKQGQKALQTKG